VGIDRPDDADAPPDNSAHRTPAAADAGRTQAEPRYRQEYDAAQRGPAVIEERTEPVGHSEPGARSKTEEPAKNGQQADATSSWEETAELSRWMWSEYKRRWPPEQRAPVDRSSDPPGSWRSDRHRSLDSAANARIEAECDRIAEREKEKISPAMRDAENQDPARYLIDFESRLKGRDRIKEKVADSIRLKHHTPKEAISLLPDAIRYTFQYDEDRYTRGVQEDIDRMKNQGFRLQILRNSWSSDQYKGVNSQWIDPESSQRFELQFHTRVSLEAKQITHSSYERLRSKQADAFEELVLEAFQKKVVEAIPIPPGATNIPDYEEGGRDAR
jgi:hypothetical protein